MPEMMLAEAGRLMMRRLLMPLWSLRRARRDVTLAQPANGRAGPGEDGDSDLDEAEVSGDVEMNGHDDNDVGDMGYIMIVSCGDGSKYGHSLLRKRAHVTNRNIVSRRRPAEQEKKKFPYF